MLNLTLIQGANQYAAAHYFSAADDYYVSSDEEGGSQWQGRGAAELGLAGTVDQTAFSRLLSGLLPDGSHIETSGKKRMGWDMTFSAPKSISLQALVADDKRIAQAHDEAVSVVLAQLEPLALARKKVRGVSSRERTGNMVIAKFRHALSREKDPQLHTHAVILNMTRRADGAWRALSSEDLYRIQREMDALYKLELANRIRGLGYEIRLTDGEGNFELAHISRMQIEAFSARSATIEAVLAKRGKSRATASTKEKQQIALSTRKRKEKTDIAAVRTAWLERSAEVGINYTPRFLSDWQSHGSGQADEKAVYILGAEIPMPTTAQDGSHMPGEVHRGDKWTPSGDKSADRASQGGDRRPETESGNTDPVDVGGPQSVTRDEQVSHEHGRSGNDGNRTCRFREDGGRARPASGNAVSHDHGRSPSVWENKGDGRYGDSSDAGPPQIVAWDADNLDPAQAVVRWTIQHLTEREACVSERNLVRVALERAVGLNVTHQSVLREIARQEKEGGLIAGPYIYAMVGDTSGEARSPAAWAEKMREANGWDLARAKRYVDRSIEAGVLIRTERSFTTPKALEQEKACLAIEREGRGGVAPLMSASEIERAFADTPLNAGQRAAVKTILGSRNRFIGVQGDAGTGKTFTVKYAVDLVHKIRAGKASADYRVLAIAPYGNQVKALKNDGLDAKTLASFLYSRNKKINEKTVVVLDEAAIVGSRQMGDLMRAVAEAGSRLVMLGDTKQTEAIEAGKPFAQLQYAGMETARISEILRQQNPQLKRAVENVVAGRTQDSLRDISIVQVKDATARHQNVVDDLMKMPRAERENTLVIAGTNEARHEINQLVRRGLGLEGVGKHIDTLSRVDMTQAERRVADKFKVGMVVQPERDYPKANLIRYQNYVIRAVCQGNILKLESEKDGSVCTINPRNVTQLSVYNLERAEMSVGDMVRITRNDVRLDLTNGDLMRVTAVTPNRVTVQRLDGSANAHKPLDLDARVPLHLVHAYSSTVHSSQGMTCSNVLISMGAFSRTTSRNLYYVAISRAKNMARIYTDAANKLPTSVARLLSKTEALSLVRDRHANRRVGMPALQRASEENLQETPKPLQPSMLGRIFGRF